MFVVNKPWEVFALSMPFSLHEYFIHFTLQQIVSKHQDEKMIISVTDLGVHQHYVQMFCNDTVHFLCLVYKQSKENRTELFPHIHLSETCFQ